MTTSQHPLFPITLPTKWLEPHHGDLSDHLKNWLLDKSSLTARLKKHSTTFRVELLGQQIEPCSAIEANKVIQPGEQVLVREVILYCDNVPQVFARSLIPLTSLTGEEQQLANLGTRPLGQMLFNSPSLKREGIEISCFKQSSSVGNLCNKLGIAITHNLWGRRSVFMLENKPLMVAEVFLPASFAYQFND